VELAAAPWSELAHAGRPRFGMGVASCAGWWAVLERIAVQLLEELLEHAAGEGTATPPAAAPASA